MSRRSAAISLLCLLLMAHSQSALAGDEINWFGFDDLDKQERYLIRLEEEESVTELSFARVRLKQSTPKSKTDSLFIYNENGCGSGGCRFQIFMTGIQSSTLFTEVLSITLGEREGVALGRQYSGGVRNLRFSDAVTWKWNGQSYELK